MKEKDSGCEIHRLTEDDAERFYTLRLQGLREEPNAFGSTCEEETARGFDFVRQRFATAHKRDNNAIFGAFQKVELLGIVGLAQQERLKLRHRATLWGMYVSPSARGMGLGKLLCHTLIGHVRQNLKDVEMIDLIVESTNEPAKRLYASLGFKVWGIQEKALKSSGQYFDEECMALVVPRSNSTI